MTDNWLLRGWRTYGLLALALVFYVLCGKLSLSYRKQLTFSDLPAGDAPWYFIRGDVIDGLCMLLYLVLCLAIGALAISKRWHGGATMIFFGVIWSAAQVWQLGLIYLKSDHIFDPVAARTSWLTADSYFDDPMQWGWLLLFLFALPFTEQIKSWLKNRPADP